jgi:cytochrome b561
MTKQPQRYHPVHVTLHWLIAIVVIGAITYAMNAVGGTPNDSPDKAGILLRHAIIGGILLVLMIARLITRFTLPRPAPATTGNKFLDFVAKAVHFLLYFVVIGMLISGMGIAAQANLPAVFRGEIPVPENFFVFLPRQGHGLLFSILFLLILLHVGAAFFHQFIKKDNLLSRMWYGK